MTGEQLRHELDALVENTDIWHVLHQLVKVCEARRDRSRFADERAAWRTAAGVIETCSERRAIAHAADTQR